jgi:hypothetical protein
MRLASKKTILLLVFIFFLSLAIFIGVILVRNRTIFYQKAAPSSRITLTSAGSGVELGKQFQVAANIDTGENEVVGIELDLAFDPAKLRLSSVSPGPFLASPDAVGPVIDNSQGTAHYTLLVSPGNSGKKGQGIIAYFNFDAIGLGPTEISVNTGESIAVALKEGGQNVLTGSMPLVINVFEKFALLSLELDKSVLSQGDNVKVFVNIDTQGRSVNGAEFDLIFDASKLQFLAAAKGSFFASPDAVGPDSQAGAVHYSLMLPPEAAGQSGQGRLAELSFEALGLGETGISFNESNTYVAGLGNGSQNVLESTSPVSLTIESLPSPTPTPTPVPTPTPFYKTGDINKDGHVNILDYIILLEHFAMPASSYPNADINDDGRISLYDYILLYENLD